MRELARRRAAGGAGSTPAASSTSAAETAPASVAAAAGCPRPCSSMSAAASSMLLGLTIAVTGEGEAAVGRRDEQARPVLGEQRVRGDAVRGGRGRDLDHALRPRGRDGDDVEAVRD